MYRQTLGVVTDTEYLTLTPSAVPPDEIIVTWITNPPLKSGTYKWSLTFQVLPIPFISSWIAELMAGAMDDQTKLNQALANAGVTGTAEMLEKQVYYKANWYGAVYEFTIEYRFKLTLQAGASLIAFVVLLPFLLAIASIVGYIVIGVFIVKILSKVEEIIEGPPSPNLGLIVIGALGAAYLVSKR